jgi:hypothetical protein
LISDFHSEVAENCTLLGYYAVSSGNFCIIAQKGTVLIDLSVFYMGGKVDLSKSGNSTG